MPFPTINLDDRDFAQLVSEAKSRINQVCPQWSDLSAGDPGLMLVELFAFLTETMIYRLNRLPQKAFVEFLNLLGVSLQPPASASTKLRFSLDAPLKQEVVIPEFTRVAGSRGSGGAQAPVFVTASTARIPKGATECTVEAYHADIVEAELAGIGTGQAGFSVSAAMPPIVAERLCIVGVEADPDEVSDRVPSIMYNGKTYRIWKEVDAFANLGDDGHVYIIDRMSGLVTFAPALRRMNSSGRVESVAAALAEIVKQGKEVRLWYAHGGGPAGNMAPNSITVLKDALPGIHLTVTNPDPSTGGAAAETYENALIRGPLQFRSLERAVTAGDFELIAKKVSGAICRALALTKAALWKHAERGTVSLLVVPSIPEDLWNNGRITLETISGQQNKAILNHIHAEINKRTPLGITCSVDWVRYKRVSVGARVVVNSGEKIQLVQNRVLDRLYETINPIPTDPKRGGWEFDTPLRVSKVFDIILAEPGVRYADNVRLMVERVPAAEVVDIHADAFQDRMWYAACGKDLFRSWDDGEGWQIIASWEKEEIRCLEINSEIPGFLAVSTIIAGSASKTSCIYVSTDCGLTFRQVMRSASEIRDIAWIERDNEPMLLIAADTGLYELKTSPSAVPLLVVVDAAIDSNGYYAVEAATDARGILHVAVAAQKTGGVYLSIREGRNNTFSPMGLKGEDIRLLKAQQYDSRVFLWAGVTSPGTDPGKGCFRLELRGNTSAPDSWTPFAKQWTGGSCEALAFINEQVIAGTHDLGVFMLDSKSGNAAWTKFPLECGLPLRDTQRMFEPIAALDAQDRNGVPFMMVGGLKGVYACADKTNFANISRMEFTDRVTLPPGWLFCSGEHLIKVVTEDEEV